MSSTRQLLALVFCLSVFGVVGLNASANFTDNGDFELGTLDGWQYQEPGFAGDKFSLESATPAQGSFYGRIDNSDLASPAVVKQPNIGFPVIQANSFVEISFFARGDADVGGVHFVELFSELSGGGTSKSEILGGGGLNPPSDTDWTFYSFVRQVGPDVSGGVTLQFNAVTGGAAGSFSVFEFDDVSLTVFDGLPGDYNDDQEVNLADYTVWRDNLGGDPAALNGNGTGNLTVGLEDYNLWQDFFGTSAAGSLQTLEATGIPEPSSVLVLVSAVAGLLAWRRRSA